MSHTTHHIAFTLLYGYVTYNHHIAFTLSSGYVTYIHHIAFTLSSGYVTYNHHIAFTLSSGYVTYNHHIAFTLLSGYVTRLSTMLVTSNYCLLTCPPCIVGLTFGVLLLFGTISTTQVCLV